MKDEAAINGTRTDVKNTKYVFFAGHFIGSLLVVHTRCCSHYHHHSGLLIDGGSTMVLFRNIPDTMEASYVTTYYLVKLLD